MCFLFRSEAKLQVPYIDKEIFTRELYDLSPSLAALIHIDEAVNAVSQLVLKCVKDEGSFYHLPTRLKRTQFRSINGLNTLTHFAKILVFKKGKDKVDICISFRSPAEDEEEQKSSCKDCSKGFMIRCHLKKPNSTEFIKVVVLSASMLNTEENARGLKRFRYNFDQETSLLKKLKGTPGIVKLFHSVQYDRVKRLESGEKVPCVKQRMIEARYLNDGMDCTIGTNKGKQPGNEEAIPENIIRLLLPLRAMEKKRIFHGDIKPGNILARLVEKKGTKLKALDWAYCDLAFSSKYGRRNRNVTLRGLTHFYASYDTLKELALSGEMKLSLKKEGRPDDVWALGCTIFYLLYRDENRFSLFQLDRPAVSHLGICAEEMLKKLEESEEVQDEAAETAEGSVDEQLSITRSQNLPLTLSAEDDGVASAVYNSFSMTEGSDPFYLSEGTRSGEMYPLESYEKMPQDNWKIDLVEYFNSINNSITSLSNRLEKIDLQNLADIFEEGNTAEVNRFVEDLRELIYLMNDDIFTDEMVRNLKSDEQSDQLKGLYEDICQAIIVLNGQYQEKIEIAAEMLANAAPREDLHERLVQRMIHPDPKQRITVKEALKECSKAYPELYKRLAKEMK